MVFKENINWRLVRIAAVTMLLALVGVICQPRKANAFTVVQNQGLGYPHSQMPCEHYPYNIAGRCANYDWGPRHTEAYDDPSEISKRGYAYRNCTDYVAWKLGSLGVNIPYNLGNAADWYGHVSTVQRLHRAKKWSAAVRPGGYGHVAFVESIRSVSSDPANDVITVSEYNFYGVGTGSSRTGRVSELGFTGFIDFGARPVNNVSAPAPTTNIKVAVVTQTINPLPPKPVVSNPAPIVSEPKVPEPIAPAPSVTDVTTPAPSTPKPNVPVPVQPAVDEDKITVTTPKDPDPVKCKPMDKEKNANHMAHIKSKRAHTKHHQKHQHHHHKCPHHTKGQQEAQSKEIEKCGQPSATQCSKRSERQHTVAKICSLGYNHPCLASC